MEDKKDEVIEQPIIADASTAEDKDKSEADQPAGDDKDKTDEQDEKIELTKEDYEELKRKEKDYHGMINAKQAEKLAKKTDVEVDEVETPAKTDTTVDEIEKAKESAIAEIRNATIGSTKDRIEKALSSWTAKNKWAEFSIDEITEKFNIGNAITEDEIVVQIDKAAQSAKPVEYEKSKEERIRTKILTEQAAINAGGGSGASVPGIAKDINNATAEDKRLADKFFKGNIEKYLKFKEEKPQ